MHIIFSYIHVLTCMNFRESILSWRNELRVTMLLKSEMGNHFMWNKAEGRVKVLVDIFIILEITRSYFLSCFVGILPNFKDMVFGGVYGMDEAISGLHLLHHFNV